VYDEAPGFRLGPRAGGTLLANSQGAALPKALMSMTSDMAVAENAIMVVKDVTKIALDQGRGYTGAVRLTSEGWADQGGGCGECAPIHR
jgi:hypothetical protein